MVPQQGREVSVTFLFDWCRKVYSITALSSPHMRKLYGDTLRSDAGFVKVIKKVAKKNARMLETRAGRHAPEIRRVAREVKGTFDKVYVETAEVLEDFLAKCACGIYVWKLQLRMLTQSPAFSAPKDLGGHARYESTAAAISRTSCHLVRPSRFVSVF